MSATRAGALKRRDVHPGPLIDGRPARDGRLVRLKRQTERLLTSDGEREEAAIERRFRTHPGVTRANTIALISPKGGVGKTTSTFLIGNLLAGHLKLRAIAVDANPDFGTLARLAPDDRRSERSLADLFDDSRRFRTAAELNPYVSRLPSGLHVLGAPRDPEQVARLGPDRYGELVAFLSCFYEVVLLDLGTGVAGPLARFAIKRADQVVLVTTPE
ncbi:MAG: AAA family ATPase, partial [Solirubrobacteraceae bacterium]